MTCGDTIAKWVPVLGSIWTAEVYIGESEQDLTAAVVFTYSGQVASTTIIDTGKVLVGSWDHDGTTLTWSGTDVLDNSYRLTFTCPANDCGPLGAVHSANGTVYQQDVGVVGSTYITRVV